MSKESIAIAGLFGTIANLQSNDFNIYAVYNSRLGNITVRVAGLPRHYKTSDVFIAYTTELDQIHALEDDLVELKEEWNKK